MKITAHIELEDGGAATVEITGWRKDEHYTITADPGDEDGGFMLASSCDEDDANIAKHGDMVSALLETLMKEIYPDAYG